MHAKTRDERREKDINILMKQFGIDMNGNLRICGNQKCCSEVLLGYPCDDL